MGYFTTQLLHNYSFKSSSEEYIDFYARDLICPYF